VACLSEIVCGGDKEGIVGSSELLLLLLGLVPGPPPGAAAKRASAKKAQTRRAVRFMGMDYDCIRK